MESIRKDQSLPNGFTRLRMEFMEIQISIRQTNGQGMLAPRGVDYDKTFALVVKWGTICLVIALSIHLQMDV